MTEIFIKHYGVEPTSICQLSGSGSNRIYYRLTHPDGYSVIGVRGTLQRENHAFITMARHFKSLNLNTPELIAVSHDEMTYLQQDLGNIALFDVLKPHIGNWHKEQSAAGINIIKTTLNLLAHFQITAHKGMDYSVCFPVRELDKRSIMWDLNYFKYCYLKLAGIEFDESALEDIFENLCHELLTRMTVRGFMYRDFQSRNVMLTDGKPMFIDFQGGRYGPLIYDVVSFLWQARLQLPDDLRTLLFEEYLEALSREQSNINKQALIDDLPYWVFFRNLQVLGAYGFRGYYEKKQHFLESIKPALDNIKKQTIITQYPAIAHCLINQQ
jgi:aminoglycoside/choline kinase family phosphotransferase